jgi:OOP family OmpA-OmpF porin
MRKFAIAAFAALGLMSASAMADENSGFYAGLGVGVSDLTVDSFNIGDGESFKFDDGDTAYKVFGGWRFMKYVAVELDYLDLGQMTDRSTFDTGEGDVTVTTDIEVSGWAPYVVGMYPIGMFELSAKLGWVFYDVDFDAHADGVHEGDSEGDDDFAWGVGAGVTLFDRLNVKLEYEAIEVSDADLAVYWLTGAWRF